MSHNRLKQILAEIRKLPECYEYRPNDWSKPHGERIGGSLLAEALDLGAFTSQRHTAMRARLLDIINDTESGRAADSRRCGAFREAGGWLHGKPCMRFDHASWREDCHAIADGIEQDMLNGASNQEATKDERTPPMSKAALARLIQGRDDARPREIAWDRFDLQSISGRKWTVSLNAIGVDAAMRRRLKVKEP